MCALCTTLDAEVGIEEVDLVSDQEAQGVCEHCGGSGQCDCSICAQSLEEALCIPCADDFDIGRTNEGVCRFCNGTGKFPPPDDL